MESSSVMVEDSMDPGKTMIDQVTSISAHSRTSIYFYFFGNLIEI